MQKKTLLIVDDEPDNLNLAERTLKKEDYRLIFATNGFEAIEVAEREKPDLVLLDVMMPGMDGFNVLERWKESGKLKSLRVIVLSALSDKQSVLTALEGGAVDYISKPFDSAELKARIKIHLQLISAQENLEVMDMVLGGARWWIIKPLRDILNIVSSTKYKHKIERSLREVIKRLKQGRLYFQLQNVEFDKKKVDIRQLLNELLVDKESSTQFEGGLMDRFSGQAVVLGDEIYLTEVFKLLRDYADSRSPLGYKMKVELSGGTDTQRAIIGFADYGPPLPPEEIPLVFTLFPDADLVGNKGRTTTLALPLAKIIVEAHGGEITCKSTERMTHFYVLLPTLGGN